MEFRIQPRQLASIYQQQILDKQARKLLQRKNSLQLDQLILAQNHRLLRLEADSKARLKQGNAQEYNRYLNRLQDQRKEERKDRLFKSVARQLVATQNPEHPVFGREAELYSQRKSLKQTEINDLVKHQLNQKLSLAIQMRGKRQQQTQKALEASQRFKETLRQERLNKKRLQADYGEELARQIKEHDSRRSFVSSPMQ